MTDWADALANEITEKYWHHGDGESYQDTPPKVWAAALRKAKADGLKEAAEMLDGDGKWNCGPSCMFDDEALRWAKHFREAASKLTS